MALLITASTPASWMKRGALLGLFLLGATTAWSQIAAREYQIKAVFLFNFAQFVEWPPAAFPEATSPLIIGVLGPDPFGRALDETVRGEKIGDRPLVIRRYQRVTDVDQCHILFINQAETGTLEQTLDALKGRSILTVADAEGFALRGVMVRFVNEKNRIRLRINLDEAKAAGLTISSKLLRPAEIISTRKN
ncbi:MAG: YfiR family protein [Lacunisphaera sp.]|nr:YfiR family protein [Lacunisphaera sp.]